MDFRRILANAVARRVAFVLVAALFAWLGIGNARAQTYTQGSAWIKCNQDKLSFGGTVCRDDVPNKTVMLQVAPGGPGYWTYNMYPYGTTCAAVPDNTTGFQPRNGSIGCNAGCEIVWFRNPDGTSTAQSLGTKCVPEEMPTTCTGAYHWNALLNVCEPEEGECEANAAKDSATGLCMEACPSGMILGPEGSCVNEKNECPAGNVKAPSGECLPGDGQCAAGKARRPNGTCGKDSDGDGEADEDDEDPENDPEKETASGGDSCDSPPSCSGSAIACMQVKIQWRIDCNTRKAANVSGGTCAAMPVCTGKSCDALEYAQLLQQWKAACALEKLATGGSGGGDSDGVVELLTGPGSINSNAGGGDSLDDGNPWVEEGEEYEPDASGYGWSRSCPSPPSLSLPGGQSVQIDLTPLCNWVSLGGTLVLILAGLMSLRIVAGGAA